jgi:Cu-Zn family superoxide dismutase
MFHKSALTALCVAALLSAACARTRTESAEHHPSGHESMWSGITHAVAVLHPTTGNTARGVVHLREADGKVAVVVHVEGLIANSTHAIHIHEFGDCTAQDGTSAGGHYNPEGHDHGLPEQSARHAGDLGNLTANENGAAHYEVTVDNISIAGMKNPVIGRGVILHAQPDTGAQPVGEAGARIACGVIGIAKSPE